MVIYMKRIIAFILCLILMAALVPAALAEPSETPDMPDASEAVSGTNSGDPVAAALAQKEDGTDAAVLSFAYTGPVTDGDAVTDYSYEVYPILAPFPYFIYVKTDNPDPLSFRLVDKASCYFGPDDKGEVEEWSRPQDPGSYVECDPGTYYLSTKLFHDVVYENRDARRVPGGYIFETARAFPDGGELVLQKNVKRDADFLFNQYADTDVTVACQQMQTLYDYLIDTCTDPSKSLFENLNALERGMNAIGIYPQHYCSADLLNEDCPFPYIYSSPYPEHSLRTGCSRYLKSPEWVLASQSYPFIMDSLSYPGVIATIAKRLEPNAVVEQHPLMHWMINVTYNGETHMYGGSGRGGNDSLEDRRIEKRFTFAGDANDLAVKGTVQAYHDLLLKYHQIAAEDMKQWTDLVKGEPFYQTIRGTGGTWIRLAGSYDLPEYGYAVPFNDGYRAASQAWVDGRYIDKYEHQIVGERFEDHPTADIILHNVSYTDSSGAAHCQDVIYAYESASDAWVAGSFYSAGYYVGCGWTLPDSLILTREEAEEAIRTMDIPANGKRFPESGLIYDGQSYPGTPFRNVLATGVHIPETYEAVLGKYDDFIPVTMVPENAVCAVLTWESSDPDVVECKYSAYEHRNVLNSKKLGTATLNGTTADGGYRATCVVTVVPNVTFLEQPQPQTVSEGETVRFHVAVSVRTLKPEEVRYQWESSFDGQYWFNAYETGNDTDTLTLQPSSFLDGHRFRCRIYGANGVNAYSDAVMLTVKEREIGSIGFADGAVQYKGGTPYVIANGKAQTPRVVVKDENGRVIDEDMYEVTYRENKKPGTAYVDVRMYGRDTVLTQFFKIYLPATTETTIENTKDGIRLTWKSVPGAKGYVIYRRAWNLKSSGWTDFTRWNNTTRTAWTDTQVYAGTRYQYGVKAYFAPRTGVDGATIGGAMDNYNLGIVGPLKTTVRITTRKLESVTAGKQQLTVKWSGSKLFTGYEVQIATNSSFTKNVGTVKIADAKTYETTVADLKARTTYYVRVRSYHEFEGFTYYGQWSNVLSRKTK